MTMVGAYTVTRHTPNFKGKQRDHWFSCNCCFCINDKREKVEKARLKEAKEELRNLDP